MFTAALTFDAMKDGIKRLTIELPEDLHDLFWRQCALATPRRTMKQRIIEFVAHEVGKPVPQVVDRRKMTRKEREAYDAAPAKVADAPTKKGKR